MTDPHSPRKHDHLVEPMYAGLGAKSDERSGGARTRWLFWVVATLVLVLLVTVLS